MYLDTEGNVTIGYGHLVPGVEAARSLGFVNRETNEKAEPQDIERDYNDVKNSGSANTRAGAFRSLTNLDIPRDKIDRLLNDDVKEFLR